MATMTPLSYSNTYTYARTYTHATMNNSLCNLKTSEWLGITANTLTLKTTQRSLGPHLSQSRWLSIYSDPSTPLKLALKWAALLLLYPFSLLHASSGVPLDSCT